jgi:hypothetical protein
MRVKDTIWQGCFGDWQPLFIHEYWLPLGHLAWQGFVQQGRGLVMCEVYGITAAVDWSRAAIPYTARFMPQAELSIAPNNLGLTVEHRSILATAVAAYNPSEDVILLLISDSPPYITHLQGWAVPPPECFRQMGDRQAEFVLAPET